MHILIVDDEPMMADYLVETIGEKFPDSWIESAISNAEARTIAGRMDELDLLVTDIMLGDTDGFALRESLIPQFPRMQTVFVTGHDISSFGEVTSGKKILLKPLDPQEIALAISNAEETLSRATEPGAVFRPVEHATVGHSNLHNGSSPLSDERQRLDTWTPDKVSEFEASSSRVPEAPSIDESEQEASTLLDRQGFTGKLDQFQLIDIIQLCCLSGRTGRLTISKGLNSGVLFFSRNNIVHAACGEMQGEEAAFRIISWQSGSFNFAEGILPDNETIHRSWENLMMEGAVEGDETGTGESAVKKETGLLGETLGAYHVVRKLGTGIWGGTYEARVAGSEDRVTLKVLSPEKTIDPVVVQEFIADANTKSNITHPNMVSVPHGVAESDGIYFYPRDFVDGESLDDYRAKGQPVSEEQAVSIIRTVAETLLYLNQHKIPHSPLKPSSVFLTKDNSVRLANLSTFDSGEQPIAQIEIRELSRTINAAMQGGMAISMPLRQLLTKMLVQSAAGIPSWGAMLQAIRTFDAPPPSAIPVPVAVPRAVASPQDQLPAAKKRNPAVLYGSIGAAVALLAVVLLLVF